MRRTSVIAIWLLLFTGQPAEAETYFIPGMGWAKFDAGTSLEEAFTDVCRDPKTRSEYPDVPCDELTARSSSKDDAGTVTRSSHLDVPTNNEEQTVVFAIPGYGLQKFPLGTSYEEALRIAGVPPLAHNGSSLGPQPAPEQSRSTAADDGDGRQALFTALFSQFVGGLAALGVFWAIRGPGKTSSKARLWGGYGAAICFWQFAASTVNRLANKSPMTDAIADSIGMLLWGIILGIIGYGWGRSRDRNAID